MLTDAAFTSLYHRYVVMVRHRANAIVRNPQLVEDIVQETFMRFIGYDRANEIKNPPALLFRMVTNVAFNRLRKKSDVLSMEEVVMANMPESISAEERLSISQVLATCDADEAQLVFMYYVDNMSHDEIAQILGVSRRTVGYRLQGFTDRALRLTAPRLGRVKRVLRTQAL